MNLKVSTRTDFLFARPSFASGAARALDLYGNYSAYNSSTSEVEADQSALASDWAVVGADLAETMEQAKTK
jgi:hypothetical protein